MEVFNLEHFLAKPSWEYIQVHKIRKDDWLALGRKFEIEVKSYWTKQRIIDTLVPVMVAQGIISDAAYDLVTSDVGAISKTESDIEFEKVKLQQLEKQKEIERLRLEKETELELKRLEDKEKERQFQQDMLARTGSLHLTPSASSSNLAKSVEFDVVRAQRALPKFDEREPDEFFQLFEKVALNLKWPKDQWPSLVQGVLVGKGRTRYLSLSVQQCQDYDIVRQEILKAYEITAEFYHAKFRFCRLEHNMSFTDYSHEVGRLLNNWLNAVEIDTYKQLRETLCLEQFLSGIPNDIQVYI